MAESSRVESRFVGAILLASSAILFAGGAALSFSSAPAEKTSDRATPGVRQAPLHASVAPAWPPEDPRIDQDEAKRSEQEALHRRAVGAILLFGLGIVLLATGGHVVGLTSRGSTFPDE